ncbi:MAG: tape measure protein [Firmicutes bacterium]|nr:tape measure protein [Bacillota bacterium]
MQGIATTIRLVDQMTAPIMSINNAINNLITGFNNVESASDINTASLEAMQRQVEVANFAAEQLNQSFRIVEDTVQEMTNGQNAFNNSVRQGHSAADGLTQKIGAAVAAYASIQGVKTVLGLSDQLTQITARLNMMNDGLQTTQDLQNMIFLAAERSRGSYQATADAVSKMGIMARDAFSNNAELIAFAEQLNKQFTIAGTSSQGIDAAMLQLTQAMGSGVLRGEELNSVFEQAPTIIQTIADYLDVPIGKIRKMAEDGQLTAGIVKNALLSAADETNAKFEQMPKTWAQVWTSFQNQALFAFQPVLQRINALANSPGIQTFVNNAVGAMVRLSNVALNIFNVVGSVAQFIGDTWSMVAPLVLGAAAAMAVYWAVTDGVTLAQKIGAAVSAAYAAVQNFLSIGFGVLTGSTAAASAAVFTFNSALLASPITWIVMIIAVLIGVLYAVVAAVNHFAGTSVSATGIIFGAFAWLGSVVANIFMGLFELVLGVINALVNPFIEIANFIGNVFQNPISSIIYMFQGMADGVLAILQKIASALDFVFGSNMADAVAGWRSGLKDMADAAVAEYAPNENYQKVIDNLNLSVEGLGLKRLDNTDAYSAGYKVGEGIDKSISDMFSFNIPGLGDMGDYGAYDLSNIDKGVSNIDANTKGQLDYSEEELKLWRDIAERETINRYTTVDMGGFTFHTNNTVNSDVDLDGIVDYIGEQVEERLQVVAEGVHL